MTFSPSSADPWLALLHLHDRALPLSILGGIHPTGVTDGWSQPTWKEIDNGWTVDCRSTHWESVQVRVEKVGEAWEIGMTVKGRGEIDRVTYLEGAQAELLPDPKNTMTMVRHHRMPPRRYGRATPVWHRRTFNPQPEARSGPWLDAFDSTLITAAGTFGPDRFDTFFTPGIWCYVLDLGEGHGVFSMGLVAEPGTQHFHTFGYRGGSHFGLSLDYDGKLVVDGEFSPPRLRIAWSKNEEMALTEYVHYLRDSGRVAAPVGKAIPAWWRRPIVCGWGSQVAWSRLASEKKLTVFDQGPIESSAPAFATQAIYEKIIGLLDEHRLPYGTLIIDLGWSVAPGIPERDKAKWPDLAGFIRKEHERGRKVLLWLGCWTTAGLPKKYLMEADEGLKPCIDPTRPAFREALQKEIAHLLGPEIDADGFKLDFTSDLPRGRGYRPAGLLWGMELLRSYLELIHSSAKAAKPDAMILTHCANPYFGDVTDVLRLNDLFSDQIDVRPHMAFRARMARIACPEWLVDCDGDPFNSAESWRQYQLFQPTIGIPSLYDLTHTSGSTELIPAQWVEEIRAIWEQYREGNGL